jgi:cephalosporin-C deacetylase-like acetyl esterase
MLPDRDMLRSAPEDYGLSIEQTLAHTVQSSPPSNFESCWSTFREEIETLSTHWQGSIDAPVNQLLIRSSRDVRVVGQLILPDQPPVGLVVTSLGSSVPAGFPAVDPLWSDRGLATLQLRVRGFPPSTAELGDLGGEWILHKLGVEDAWIVRGAVADVVQAVRCARRHFGNETPIMLHGESLGGGLAVMAASQLERLGEPPLRLVIGLPDCGDWRWRADHFCNGAGGLVNEALIGLRDDREGLMRTLLLFDTAHHASTISVPTLVKLAERDDAVPAPSAAAVYNALASACKQCFVVPYGHFDGGMVSVRRHEQFERLASAFLDPRRSPEKVIASVSAR